MEIEKNNFILSFEIYGITAKMIIDDERVAGWFEDYLARYLCSLPKSADISFDVKVNPPKLMEVPEDAEWFLNYYGLAGFTSEETFFFRAYDSVFRFVPSENHIEGTLSPGILAHPRFLTHVFFTIVLFETLRYHGLYYIHSAGLVSENDKGLLIPANASSGKSTLSIALLHNGYRCVSDDALFAKWVEESVELVPFKREFHVSLRTAEVFPELNYLLKEPPYFPGLEKRAFEVERIYPTKIAEVMDAPSVVLFPEIVPEKESSIKPLNPQEALVRMIKNSALVMFSQPAAKKHLEALKAIVSSAECFVLKSGRDVYYDPITAVSRILEMIGLI